MRRNSNAKFNEKSIPGDDSEYAERCNYWDGKSKERRRHFHARRREREPIILTGHGVYLRIDRGTLHVKNGFTHYPQERAENRFFPGDLNLPTRIVLVDCSGSISFDVLSWLTEQRIPLVQINWRGDVQTVSTPDGYSADSKLVQKQLENLKAGHALKSARNLVCQKLENSIETVKRCAPESIASERAISQITADLKLLKSNRRIPLDKMLGVEGRSAAPYFRAFVGTPIKWKSLGRKPIPSDWHRIGWRLSPISNRNRNARHPANAILNYAYAVAKAQIKIQLLAEGYDPTIGMMHHRKLERDNLVLDLLEPMRPVVDRVLFEMVQETEFVPADFSITPQGVCRLNPQMARRVVRLVGECIQAQTGRS
jgi:CRISPR-associated endonuclease Cas1